MKGVTQMQYYMQSGEDIGNMSIKKLTLRVSNFRDIHNDEIKFRIKLAGG